MKTIKNKADYQAIINSNQPVLLDFYADWCGPCRVLLPTVERLAEKHEGKITVAKVNVDQNSDLARDFGVRSIPALFFVQNGEIKERLVGVQSEAALNNKILAYTSVEV